MARAFLLAAVLAAATSLSAASPADAGDRRAKAGSDGPAHPQSSAYRGPRVKGFVARRGGYSYSAPDTINTYGDARTRYGGVSSYRDPFLDRQTNAGPFDHGFFFDSGIGPRGGDSPYMN
jgi:hypothetical protein